MVRSFVLPRPEATAEIRRALRRQRIVALVGPRQSGKTTLARELVSSESPNYFDLEDPTSLAPLADPMIALRPLRGLVVIDEVQRRPDLFPVLRVLSDRRPLPARFLVLGSASPDLLRQSTEALAGRLEVLTLPGFTLGEVGTARLAAHWRRGGFPRSLLARSEAFSVAWRRDFIQTFLERDAPQLGLAVPAPALLRFWTMLAHWHGRIWKASEPARSLGVSEPTVRRHLDFLTSTFMVRQLQPWHENLSKRQVKAPKVYVRDSGLLHQLLGVRTERDLLSHPQSGSSWEGYAIEETLKSVRPDQAYFWATHQGAELDLLLFVGDRRLGVEVKRADAPAITPSMRIALADLRLDHLFVLYPGTRRYQLADRITVLPLTTLAEPASDWLPPMRARRSRRA
jgi:uncharacterized protein